MSDTRTACYWALRGAWFQFPMMFVWFFRGLHYNLEGGFSLTMSSLIAALGFVLMGITLVRIYTFNRKSRQLITSDVFALTRHPMYHGMFIADAAAFLTTDLTNIFFWMTWLVFTALLLVAGWHQEKETLARWGGEAEEYYEKTPRFIFEWLWNK